MIEIGSIVELSNNKKYIMTDSSIENGSVYYLALEVDYQTEMPKEDSIFFKSYLKTYFLAQLNMLSSKPSLIFESNPPLFR